MTPYTSPTPYCTPAQFENMGDMRSISRMLSVNGVPLTSAQLLVSPVLAQFLGEASGYVESMCSVGKRYSPQDLQALQGNSAAFLARIVGGLAMWFLWEFRPDALPEPPRMATWAMNMTRMLAQGQAVFGIEENAQAGLESNYSETPGDVGNRRMVTDITSRFFGTRSNRMPYPNEG